MKHGATKARRNKKERSCNTCVKKISPASYEDRVFIPLVMVSAANHCIFKLDLYIVQKKRNQVNRRNEKPLLLLLLVVEVVKKIPRVLIWDLIITF